jgi:biopolymer transport protein TolR
MENENVFLPLNLITTFESMAFTDRNGKTQTALAEINVTPLVDVMLVLLVIFMITAPILQTGIQVNLPKTREAQSKEATPQALIISVDKEGAIYLSGKNERQAININDLPEILNDRLARSNERRVYLRGDGETPYRVIAYVLDQAKRAQADVSLVTEPTRR